jgi:hypothetical protein
MAAAPHHPVIGAARNVIHASWQRFQRGNTLCE